MRKCILIDSCANCPYSKLHKDRKKGYWCKYIHQILGEIISISTNVKEKTINEFCKFPDYHSKNEVRIGSLVEYDGLKWIVVSVHYSLIKKRKKIGLLSAAAPRILKKLRLIKYVSGREIFKITPD